MNFTFSGMFEGGNEIAVRGWGGGGLKLAGLKLQDSRALTKK